MKTLHSRYKTMLFLLRVITRIVPIYPVLAVPQALAAAAIPIVTIALSRHVLNALTNGQNWNALLHGIALYSAALLLLHLASSLLKKRIEWLLLRFTKELRLEIGRTIMRMRLSDVETAGARTMLHLAGNAVQISGLQAILQNSMTQIVQITSMAYIIARLDAVFLLLVALLMGIKIISNIINNRYFRLWRVDFAQNSRMEDYLYHTRNDPGGAKELRVNSLTAWFGDKIRAFRNEMLRLQYHMFGHMARVNAISAIAGAVQTFFLLWILASYYLRGTLTIGDFSYYFGAVLALSGSLSMLVDLFGQFTQTMISVEDYHALRLLRREADVNADAPMEDSPFDILRIEHVSFRYPGSERYILRDINLTLRKGKRLAIVGENGAGKTTLVKLILKLYSPTEGVITFNGVDIQSIPNEQYYQMISAVFQDFSLFAFSIRENILLGNAADPTRLSDSLTIAGIDQWIENLPQGLDTHYTRLFDEGGMDFSGGEMQKIAIARMLWRNTPIRILDEPTASLDPLAESEIYQSLFRSSSGQTTIFISHRLAASRMADAIAVLRNGHIAEYGSHQELLHAKGIYASLYLQQSRNYAVD